MFKRSVVGRSATFRISTGLSIALIIAVLVLLMTASCTEDSGPAGPDGNGGKSHCINYRDYLHMANLFDMRGLAMGLAISGDYAYVAALPFLEILDISDPTSPDSVSIVDLQDARDVAVSGGYAYVACGSYGLRIIDISEPASPEITPPEYQSCPGQFLRLHGPTVRWIANHRRDRLDNRA